jgi:hypothetical protein
MKEKWMKLFMDFEESGYDPKDIKRIVMVYEMTRENDEMLKEMLAEKPNEKLYAGNTYLAKTSLNDIN